MSTRRLLKDALYEQVGRLVKGMANAKRLELIELLCQSPRSVEALAAEAGISVKLASAHLKELRLARLVDTERQGRQIIYRISCQEVAGALVLMRNLAETCSLELQHSLKELSSAQWPDPDTLWGKARRGEITVIDVRPGPEYRERHFPFARSIPLAELADRLHEIPKNKPVVAYCRGPFCDLSVNAVTLLRDKGFDAYQWREGAADWLADDSHKSASGQEKPA